MWVFHQQRPVSSFNLQICGFDFRSITLKLHAGLANKWELNHQKCNRRREYKLTLSNTGMEVTGLRMGTFAGHHGTLIYDNSRSRGLMVWNKQHEKYIKILDSVRERCCSCFGIWCSILRREPSPSRRDRTTRTENQHCQLILCDKWDTFRILFCKDMCPWTFGNRI